MDWFFKNSAVFGLVISWPPVFFGGLEKLMKMKQIIYIYPDAEQLFMKFPGNFRFYIYESYQMFVST